MSRSLVCHIARAGGLDEKIATVLGEGWDYKKVCNLRSLYDTNHDSPLVPALKEDTVDGSEVITAAQSLVQYRKELRNKRLKELNDSTQHIAKVFSKLYHVDGWTAGIRRDRINMVVNLFSNEVSRRVRAAVKAGIPVSRQEVCNGYKAGGELRDGQFEIFDSIFANLFNTYRQASNILKHREGKSAATINNALKVTTEYPKILDNWSSLCTFARMTLRDTEGLKMGGKLEYAAETTPDNYAGSPMEETYDIEESVKEAWMTHQAETSAFGSLGSEVRRFLSTITDVDEEGREIRDDLRFSKKMDPIKTHQYLADVLRGITTETGMIQKLKELSATDYKIKAIYDALAIATGMMGVIKATPEQKKQGIKDKLINNLDNPINETNRPGNPVLLTQLLLDMHKNLVPYSAMTRTSNGDVVVTQLNNSRNPLEDEFNLRVSQNQQLDTYSSIYNDDGSLNWEKYAAWAAENRQMFAKDPNNPLSSEYFWSKEFDSEGRRNDNRINYMMRASRAIGINLDRHTATRIFNNKAARSQFLSALKGFRVWTREAHKGDVMQALDVLVKDFGGIRPEEASKREKWDAAVRQLNDRKITYAGFLKAYTGRQKTSSKNTVGAGMEKARKMLGVIAKMNESLKIERRVSWFDRKGKTTSRYSDLTPSYMGDLVDKIQEFVNEEDAQGLKDFIMDKWGRSSFFYKDGRFLNKWLQELYDSIQTDAKGEVHIDDNALAKVFKFHEFLGSNIDGQVGIFENFTEKQHAIAMLKNFVQKRDQNGKSTLADYPCFILGDAGTQRFFTAHVYNQAEILKGMKDVFRQEIERIKYAEATNRVLEDMGYKPIENLSQTTGEFTMLTFLNKNYDKTGKYWKILVGYDNMSPEEKQGMNSMTKEEATQLAMAAVDRNSLDKAIQAYMADSLLQFKRRLVNSGILNEVKDANGQSAFVDNSGLFANNTKRLYSESMDALLEDFFWNTKYATIEQIQLFTVDPAYYDHRYPVKDLQKRYKEIYAPGKGVSLEARDYSGNLYMARPYERAAYFDDIAVSSADVNPTFMKALIKTFGENSPTIRYV